MNKYIGIIVDNVDGVTTDTDEITVDGVSQSVTVLSVKVDDALLRKVVKAVLTEAKQDDVILDLLATAEEKLPDSDTDLITSYKEAVDELLESLKNAEGNETRFTFREYVSMSPSEYRKRFCGDPAVGSL